MRARLHSAARRRWIGMTATALVVAAVAAALGAISNRLLLFQWLTAPVWLGALVAPLFARQKPRVVELDVAPGRVAIVGVGAAWMGVRRVVRSQDVTGATAAPLTDYHGGDTWGARFEDASIARARVADEVRTVWRALGLSEAGYGRWRGRRARAGRLVAERPSRGVAADGAPRNTRVSPRIRRRGRGTCATLAVLSALAAFAMRAAAGTTETRSSSSDGTGSRWRRLMARARPVRSHRAG